MSSVPAASLTEEAVAAMKASVGTPLRMLPHARRITPEIIRRFALAIGDDDPRWWDEESDAVPPVALYACTQFGTWPDTNGSPVRRILDRPLILWVGEHWRWLERVPADETIVVNGQIADLREVVRDGQLTSLEQVDRVEFSCDDGRRLARLDRRTRIFPRSARTVASVSRKTPRYSVADFEGFGRQYDAEIGMRRGAVPRYSSEVRVGDRIGPMLKGPLTVSSVVAFAMAWGGPLVPTNRMLSRWLRDNPASAVIDPSTGILHSAESAHWDRPLAQAMGLQDGYDLGPQRVGWVAHLLSDWHGDAGFLEELDVQIRAANYLGDVTWLEGEVIGVEVEGRVTVTVCARNQDGVETTRARAVVRLPARG